MMMIWVIQYWRQLALVGVLIAIAGYHFNAVRSARKEGFAQCVAAASQDVDRRIRNALEADKRAGSGAGNGGLLDSDGQRRD